mmetsp:Transcript_36413/g.76714  ORF Transcript_36413/g.76714 Transcript_36413/m.76714 type:complete len:92 (-) Transcript_36413:9-284(-)
MVGIASRDGSALVAAAGDVVADEGAKSVGIVHDGNADGDGRPVDGGFGDLGGGSAGSSRAGVGGLGQGMTREGGYEEEVETLMELHDGSSM